jgi:hypothetical protein
MLGEWQGANQRADLALMHYVKSIKEAVPDVRKRIAITNWIQAAGDRNVLVDRAQKSTNPKLRQGYQDALLLSDAEKTIATNISSYLDSRLQEGIDAGLLSGGVENYVNQIWKRQNPITQRLMAELQTGKLTPSFRFAKHRIFDSYFDGEQAGHEPVTKDIGALITAYDQAFNRSLSARAFIKNLHLGNASDGRPIVSISGSGRPVGDNEMVPDAYLIKPRAKAPDVRDYQFIDHPALRKWKWVTNTADFYEEGFDPVEPAQEGAPIVIEGDMVVHPEYAKHLTNVLMQRWLSSHELVPTILRGALNLQTELKQTMLSLSMFHQVQEGVHALGHRVNPILVPKLDLDNPEQYEGVAHGLKVAEYNALAEFSEGLSGGGGLLSRVPVLGTRILKPYTEYLFHDYIPRLKMATYLHIRDRNLARYADELQSNRMSRSDVLALSANQANVAYGELNYKMMGRNPNLQDAMRAFLLAPDFLESRAKFVGQALKPYGREQMVALGYLAATQYIGCRILNKLLDDDYHFDPAQAFTVVYGGHEYGLRSVPGDIIHLLSDPRRFFYHRLSPTVVAAVTAATGRDERGVKQDGGDQIKDFLKTPLPIVFRMKHDDKWWEPFLNGIGVSEKQYKTSAEKMMDQIIDDRMPKTKLSPDDEARSQLKRDLADRAKAGEDIADEISEGIDAGKLRPADAEKIVKRSQQTRIETKFAQIPLWPDAVNVYEQASAKEREVLLPMMMRKLHTLGRLPPTQQAEAYKKIMSLGIGESTVPTGPVSTVPQLQR